MIARAASLFLLLPLAAGAAGAAGPAGAQQFTLPRVEADAGVLLTCVASGKPARVCLGAMTLDCMAENDLGNENLEERLCTVEELVVWRRLLDRAGARLGRRMAALPEDARPVLPGEPGGLARDAARLWRQWAEGQCRLERAAQGRSARRAIVEDACLRDLTAAQYGRLQRLLDQPAQR